MRGKFVLLLIFTAAILIRIFIISRNSVPFPFDMGRDLLWAKDIAFYHIPTLIGPWASINGVYFGPLWYYILSVPLFIFRGDPISAVYVSMAAVMTTIILSYILFKNYLGEKFSILLSILIAFQSQVISISTYAFHANVLPLLTILTVYYLFLSIIKNPYYFTLAILAVSLMYHFEPATGVAFTFVPLFTFIYFRLYKSKKTAILILLSILIFFLPFIPQVVFEFRNNLIETKSLIAYFNGENESLSGYLPIIERVLNRSNIFASTFIKNFTPALTLITVPFFIVFLIGIYKYFQQSKSKSIVILFKILIVSQLIIFLVNTFFITAEIKNWYIYPLSIINAFIIAIAIHSIKTHKLIVVGYLVAFVFLNVIFWINPQRIFSAGNDPATLRNQQKAINIIYKDAQNLPFSVYVYSPAIYDFPYQYLFWWYGFVKKQPFPYDFAYLPGKPGYVKSKDLYAYKVAETKLVYLVIENSKESSYNFSDWINTFDSFEIIWEQRINQAITLQKRIRT